MAKKLAKVGAARPLYGVYPGVAMVQKWIVDMPVKTGRTLDQWIAFIRAEGPDDEKARRAWLKDEHGIGSNPASWLAERVAGGDTGLAERGPRDVSCRRAEICRGAVRRSEGGAQAYL